MIYVGGTCASYRWHHCWYLHTTVSTPGGYQHFPVQKKSSWSYQLRRVIYGLAKPIKQYGHHTCMTLSRIPLIGSTTLLYSNHRQTSDPGRPLLRLRYRGRRITRLPTRRIGPRLWEVHTHGIAKREANVDSSPRTPVRRSTHRECQ